MNSYIVTKKSLFKSFPDLMFIKDYGFIFSDYFDDLLNIEIENNNEILLNRIIKISKIKKQDSIIGDFFTYIKENQLTTKEIIEKIDGNKINKEKHEPLYNVINHEWILNKSISIGGYINIT